MHTLFSLQPDDVGKCECWLNAVVRTMCREVTLTEVDTVGPNSGTCPAPPRSLGTLAVSPNWRRPVTAFWQTPPEWDTCLAALSATLRI